LQYTTIIRFFVVAFRISLIDAHKNDGNPEKYCRYWFQTAVSDEMRLPNPLPQLYNNALHCSCHYLRRGYYPCQKHLFLWAHSI